jgi:hypothetical protein
MIMQNGSSPRRSHWQNSMPERNPQKPKNLRLVMTKKCTNNNAKCLKLSDLIINGLTTEIMIGDSEAHEMAKRWFENANKGTSNQADSSVKD